MRLVKERGWQEKGPGHNPCAQHDLITAGCPGLPRHCCITVSQSCLPHEWGPSDCQRRGTRGQGPRFVLCTVLRLHVCSAHGAPTRDVQPLTCSRETPPAKSMASPQRARPPRPTTPPLATVPESWCCPPSRDSSVAPSEVSASSPSPGLCRLHPSSWKARAAPCLLDQPSQHWPHTRVSVLSPT